MFRAAADSAVFHSPATGADRNVITPQCSHVPLRQPLAAQTHIQAAALIETTPPAGPFFEEQQTVPAFPSTPTEFGSELN